MAVSATGLAVQQRNYTVRHRQAMHPYFKTEGLDLDKRPLGPRAIVQGVSLRETQYEMAPEPSNWETSHVYNREGLRLRWTFVISCAALLIHQNVPGCRISHWFLLMSFP